MKKLLFFVLSLCFALVTTAADLNPYAYNLSSSYDPSTFTLTINYSLNAPAESVTIVAIDSKKNTYTLSQCGARDASDHTENIQLLYSDDIDILPRNEQLTWRIDVKGKNYNTHQPCGQKISTHTPFSIGIDKNPNSKYFGRIITSQTNNNYDVGLYSYDPRFQGGGVYIDSDVYLGNNQNWYDDTFLTPYRVRILQDGSGRIFVSSAAVGQPTYLWWINPNNLEDWNPLIQSHTMKEYAPVGLKNKESDSMGNIDFDLQVDGNKVNVLLFGSSITTGDQTLTGDALHSGIYTCNLSDLSGGSYRALTEDNRLGDSPHPQITRSNYQSFLNGHAQFDQFGGAWFCGYGVQSAQFPESPALVHFIDGDASRSQQYADGDYIKRKSVGSASICYNNTFDRFAISQGNLANEARIYNISQANGTHPVLSDGASVDITTISGLKYVVDMCWDYADNLYLCVRNRNADLQGVWVVAAALNGEATSTPAPINKGNEFTMTCRDVQHRVTATSSISMSCKIQNADGTDFVDGLYAECSKITLKAVPSAGYKFLGWKKDGNLVSTDLTYSFYVTQETNIMAMFEYAVYNVEWYNLFEGEQDVTDYIKNPNSEMDGKVNARLWRLFQWQFNTYSTKKKYDQGKYWNADTQTNEFHVVAFLSSTGDETVKNFMTTDNLPFFWLGKYILHITGKSSLTNDQWKYELYAFFNRTNLARNSSGTAYSYKTGNYKTDGIPTHWRKWWALYACELPMELSYDQSLPTEWNKISGPGDYKNYVSDDPRGWYKWNNVWSPQNNGNNHTHILAWRVGSATGKIVNHIPSPEPGQESVKLYATYIKKHIHENDPDLDPNDVCDAKNSDVLKLLFNANWAEAKHKITITRKLQAGMYNTICLPFNVNLKTDLPADGSLDGAEFWQYDGTVSSTYNQSGEPVSVLNFTRVTDQLVAGTPYLVEVKKDVTNDLFFSGELDYDGKSVLCDTTLRPVIADPEAEVKINFIGTINPTTIPDGALILVANNRLASTTESGRMAGMRGYFTIDFTSLAAEDLLEQAQNGRVYLSMRKPTTTSVPLAPEAEQPAQPKVQKIMRNGKIYILRGEEVYDVMGHRL